VEEPSAYRDEMFQIKHTAVFTGGMGKHRKDVICYLQHLEVIGNRFVTENSI